jgi:hypothetical protein
MHATPRSFRAIVYRLKDVEDALRSAGKSGAADELARAARLFASSPNADFLDESRMSLTNLLLGDRDLGPELLDQVLDVIALIDEAFIGLEHES